MNETYRDYFHSDAAEALWASAREIALSVGYIWAFPVNVRRYLETGEQSLGPAACQAAELVAPIEARRIVPTTADKKKQVAVWYAASAVVWACRRSAAGDGIEGAERAVAGAIQQQ